MSASKELNKLVRAVREETYQALGAQRTDLRAGVRVGDDPLFPTNGHHPEALFALEQDDPDEALAALAVPDDGRPTYFMEFTEPERMTFLSKLFQEEHASLQQFIPYRIRTAWRIVREFARVSGMIGNDERLSEIPRTEEDPWTEGGTCPVPDTKDGHTDRMWRLVEMFIGPTGLPLMPPAVPTNWRDERGVLSEYNPRNIDHDPRLHDYVRAVTYVSRYLLLEDGPAHDPAQGKYGILGMTDPYLVRLLFPSKLQILTWEEHLIDETLEKLLDEGIRATRRSLKDVYALRSHEVETVMRLVMRQTQKRISEGNADQERALMTMRLETLAQSAKSKGEQRIELGALKQLAIVLGINKMDPEDIVQEFIQMAQKRTSERRIKVLNEDEMKPRALVQDTTSE